MSAIAWRQRLSVGQPTIDEDHKHLIDYLNQLDTVLNARVFVPARVAQVLVKLLEYTKEHFVREERIMERVKYPKLEAHKLQHENAVRAITALADEFSRSPTRESAEHLYAFTADWLVNHIIMQDTQLTPYVRGVWV